jgi:hypothetical protein
MSRSKTKPNTLTTDEIWWLIATMERLRTSQSLSISDKLREMLPDEKPNDPWTVGYDANGSPIEGEDT